MTMLTVSLALSGGVGSLMAMQSLSPGSGPLLTIPVAVAGSVAISVGGLVIRDRLKIAAEKRAEGIQEGIRQQWEKSTTVVLEDLKGEIRRSTQELRKQYNDHDEKDDRRFEQVRSELQNVNISLQVNTEAFGQVSRDLNEARARHLEKDKDRTA